MRYSRIALAAAADRIMVVILARSEAMRRLVEIGLKAKGADEIIPSGSVYFVTMMR